MSYVDKSLIPGEQIVYRASLYRLPFLWLIVPAIAAFVAAVFHVWLVVLAAFIVGGLIFVNVWARRAATELAVTNKRVIIAMGAVRRRTRAAENEGRTGAAGAGWSRVASERNRSQVTKRQGRRCSHASCPGSFR